MCLGGEEEPEGFNKSVLGHFYPIKRKKFEAAEI